MYRVSYPPADLAPFVRFFWGAAACPPMPHARERVVPDGCCELIVHFGEPFSEIDEVAGMRAQPRGFLFGQLRRAMLLAPSRAAGIVAARFRPAGVKALFGIDARALGNTAVPLGDLFGGAGEEAIERIVAAGDFEQGWGLLASFLRGQASSRRPRDADFVAGRLASLLAKPGASVRGVARELSMSPRSVERHFAASVGLTPRHFIRVVRIDAAARLLRADHGPLIEVAAASCYADQAHFSREFRTLIGITPGAYMRELGHERAVIVP